MHKMLLFVAASSLALASCGKPAADNNDGSAANNGSTATDVTGSQGGDMGTAATTDVVNPETAPATAPTGTDQAGMATSAQDYVAQAAAADQFEIQSSQMVLKNSKNAEVRAFAQQMVTDHTATSKKLMDIVKTASLTAPGTGLRSEQQNNLAALRDAGGNIDQVYLEQQRAAHANAIALHQAAVNNNAMPASITGFANEVLPGIREHARMLSTMKGGSASG